MEILVIDDQELVRMSVEKYFTGLGYDTFAVKNGLEGLKILEGYKPDLIILDINMPEMSGLEMLKRLKESATPHTPIMIMSGNVADSVMTAAFNLGVVYYLKKPATLAELGDRVARIIGSPTLRSNTPE